MAKSAELRRFTGPHGTRRVSVLSVSERQADVVRLHLHNGHIEFRANGPYDRLFQLANMRVLAVKLQLSTAVAGIDDKLEAEFAPGSIESGRGLVEAAELVFDHPGADASRFRAWFERAFVARVLEGDPFWRMMALAD